MNWDNVDSLLGGIVGAVLSAPFLHIRNQQRAHELDKFKLAFIECPTAQFIKDENGLIIAVNHAFTDAFGLSMSDYEGLNLQQQQALFGASPSVTFVETDSIARTSELPIYSIENLVPPKPERSVLPRPREVHEFFVSKRRFPIRHFFGRTVYGIIGTAKSFEQMQIYAQNARNQYESLQSRSPILSALKDLQEAMDRGLSDVNKRLARGEDRFRALESAIDPDRVQTAEKEAETFYK